MKLVKELKKTFNTPLNAMLWLQTVVSHMDVMSLVTTTSSPLFTDLIPGRLYTDGKAIPQDYEKAMQYFLLASEDDNTDADNGIGTPPTCFCDYSLR